MSDHEVDVLETLSHGYGDRDVLSIPTDHIVDGLTRFVMTPVYGSISISIHRPAINRHEYVITMRGSVDGVMTRDPIGYGGWRQTFEPNRELVMTNRGPSVVKNPWLFINGRGHWRSLRALADHIVTPVMLSTSDFDVGGQTVDWFRQLAARVDDASALPRHHVVLNMVDPKTTKADAILIENAIGMFPLVETVMLRRNAYKEMDEKGLLHAIALQKQTDPNPLMRPHVRHMVEALEEATDILNNVLAA